VTLTKDTPAAAAQVRITRAAARQPDVSFIFRFRFLLFPTDRPGSLLAAPEFNLSETKKLSESKKA